MEKAYNCEKYIHCIFLNDIQKNVITNIINRMLNDKNEPKNKSITFSGDINSKNILLLTHRRTKLKSVRTISTVEISNRDIVKYQNELMNDIMKVSISIYKTKFINNFLTVGQFKENIMQVLLLRNSSANLYKVLDDKIAVNNQMDILINNEIILNYLNMLRSLVKRNLDGKNIVTVLEYSGDLILKKYIDKIAVKALEIQKFTSKNQIENCVDSSNFLTNEIRKISRKITNIKIYLQKKLRKTFKKVLDLTKMIQNLKQNKETFTRQMILKNSNFKKLFENKPSICILKKLQDIKNKTIVDCQELNSKILHLKTLKLQIMNCNEKHANHKDFKRISDTILVAPTHCKNIFSFYCMPPIKNEDTYSLSSLENSQSTTELQQIDMATQTMGESQVKIEEIKEESRDLDATEINVLYKNKHITKIPQIYMRKPKEIHNSYCKRPINQNKIILRRISPRNLNEKAY